MSDKKLFTGIAISIVAFLSMATISAGADLVIKQERHLYQMPLTENIYAETFVISQVTKSDITKNARSKESTQEILTPFVRFTNPVTVYFQIDSAVIDPGERSKVLSNIHALKVPQSAPLQITGFTCPKGTTRFNKYLSNERAKAVARLLEKEGYTVTKIEGKGDSKLISKTYPPFNRRVEITLSQN